MFTGFSKITGFTRGTVKKYPMFYYNYFKNYMFTRITKITGFTKVTV